LGLGGGDPLLPEIQDEISPHLQIYNLRGAMLGLKNMKRKPALSPFSLVFLGFILNLSGVLLSPAGAESRYQGGPVKNGATLTGKVVFKGKVPEPRPFGLIVYPDIELCQRISDGQGRRLIRDFSVSPDQGFKNVVIVIEDVKSGKPFASSGPNFTIKDCEFLPFRTVVRDGQEMNFKNLDNVFHDIQTYVIEGSKRGKRIFDRPALPNARMSAKVKLPGKGQKVVWVQCGKHSFMQSWAYVIENPYFAISNKGGRFSIPDIPPGRYRVTAWHPFMKKREEMVDFKPGETVNLDFLFGAGTASQSKD
ncbi:MAG TPA: carboxypeptidase regulatory-like domain-containing protein, partial [Nitrospiria bacterium]|nr:carboxypeptidase regulatory-like domain-containing protein [Nitrospiria bacterium]